jgi:hypothetical protein
MSSRNVGRVLIAFSFGGILFFGSSSAWATVYGWKGEGGTLHFSNDLTDVPESQRTATQKFISKLAKPAELMTSSPDAPSEAALRTDVSASANASPVNRELSVYERGLEQGLQAAERQVELAGQLAQSIVAAAPRTPPTRVIVQQSGPVIIHSRTPEYYFSPFYNYAGFYFSAPCSSTRFIPHSHFFPGLRSRGAEVFFPQGHFSHHGFLCGPRFPSW